MLTITVRCCSILLHIQHDTISLTQMLYSNLAALCVCIRESMFTSYTTTLHLLVWRHTLYIEQNKSKAYVTVSAVIWCVVQMNDHTLNMTMAHCESSLREVTTTKHSAKTQSTSIIETYRMSTRILIWGY